MKLSKNAYKIPGVFGCNCYLWINKNITLIDTGFSGNENRILDFINKIAPEKSLKTIILTHCDIDHVGSAVALRKISGAKIAIHKDDAPSVKGKRVLKEVSPVLSELIQAFSYLSGYRPFKPDILLKHKQKIDGLTIVHTPGHTRGSICLYKPRQIIFTGDSIMTTRRGNIAKIRSFITQNVKKTKKSTEQISKLNFKILAPGHGIILLENASEVVKKNKKSDG